jgi:hypothetical protein
MRYIIDGHNLIAHLPDITLDDPDDEAKLVLKLRAFAARTSDQCTVYFDAGTPAGVSRMSSRSIEVRFASHRSNADHAIMERLTREKRPHDITVVTSDNAVLDEARRHRMKTMKSSQFAALLRQPETPSKPGHDEAADTHLTASEVDEWLDMFTGKKKKDRPEDPGEPWGPDDFASMYAVDDDLDDFDDDDDDVESQIPFMETIIPRYKVLITYDIRPEKQDAYYRYVLGEFVPALRVMGIHMLSAWHIAYGEYPERQLVFVTESWDTLQSALDSPRFQSLEDRLKAYTTDYRRKVVNYLDRFQF